MCKIMVLKGIQDSKLALDFMKAVAPNMSIGNTDGIGYSAINSKNELFTEKWHRNYQFLNTDIVIDEATVEALAPYKARIGTPTVNYKAIGEVTRDDLRTVTMHTRYATCGKEFANTHPFVDNGMSLIHNGCITNDKVLNLNKISTCDSEAALQLYNNDSIQLTTSPDDLQAFVNKLRGYWAFAFLAKNIEGDFMLDIVRERASLYWASLPELGDDCMVFATTQEIIETGCKALGLPSRAKIFTLPEGNYHRFNAVTGEFVMNVEIEDSILNRPVVVNHYSRYNKGSDKEQLEFEEYYEGYGSTWRSKAPDNTDTEVVDELDISSFYDVGFFLIDRLYDYDKLMGSSYGSSYEDLPIKVRAFIEKKEEEDYIVFDDIILMIEDYQETESIVGLYKIFRDHKRA